MATASPSTDLPRLPDDAAALHALVLATLAERDAAVTERDLVLAQNDRLRHLLLKLTRMRFGAKSERLPEEQLQLGLEALEQAIVQDQAEAEKQVLPGHGGAGTGTGPADRRRGLPTEAVVAHGLVARYADHLPLYRQVQMMQRQGVLIDRATLSFWMGDAGQGSARAAGGMPEERIGRDDRPWAGTLPPGVFYSYAPSGGHIHAATLLGNYRAILQCDGYGAYKKLGRSKSTNPPVTLAFCRSHVRWGFYDLAKVKAPLAIEALQRIGALYKIEARVRGKSAADGLTVRQAESKPLVDALRTWFEAQITKLPARGPMAEAIRYALNHWDGLRRFLDDGRIEIDSNRIERAMQPVSLSRKNSLFAGSDGGGENWA